MIKDAYPFAEIKKDELFVFQSEGQQGFIIKVVQFDFEGNDTWNLGFGDLNEGDIDDKVVSNNHDAMRVIRTVAKIAINFLKKHPNIILKIRPVDEKRKKKKGMAWSISGSKALAIIKTHQLQLKTFKNAA